MPKVLQCAKCKKKFLGGTYTLLEHFLKCHQNEEKSSDIR